jgi:hypothetical protein
MSRVQRRRWLSTSGASLLAAALADGAGIAYTFEESSGSIINRQGDPAFDIASVDAQVTRGLAAPGAPDLKAYGFIETSQAPLPFGHAQGPRVNQNGWTRVTHEIVCRVPTLAQNNKWVVHGSWVGVSGLFGLSNDANNDLNTFLLLTGGYFQVLVNSRNYKSGWHHYVFLYTGTNYQGYVDAVQDFNIVTTIPGSFSDDPDQADRIIAFGGVQGSGANNCNCDIAFYAMYPNLALNQTQITAHKLASGV